MEVGRDHSQAGVLVPARGLVVLGFVNLHNHNVGAEVKGQIRPAWAFLGLPTLSYAFLGFSS